MNFVPNYVFDDGGNHSIHLLVKAAFIAENLLNQLITSFLVHGVV